MDVIHTFLEKIVNDKQLLAELLLNFAYIAAVLVVSFITMRLRKRGIKSTLWNVISFVLMIGIVFSYGLLSKKFKGKPSPERPAHVQIHYNKSLALKAQEKFFDETFSFDNEGKGFDKEALEKAGFVIKEEDDLYTTYVSQNETDGILIYFFSDGDVSYENHCDNIIKASEIAQCNELAEKMYIGMTEKELVDLIIGNKYILTDYTTQETSYVTGNSEFTKLPIRKYTLDVQVGTDKREYYQFCADVHNGEVIELRIYDNTTGSMNPVKYEGLYVNKL